MSTITFPPIIKDDFFSIKEPDQTEEDWDLIETEEILPKRQLEEEKLIAQALLNYSVTNKASAFCGAAKVAHVWKNKNIAVISPKNFLKKQEVRNDFYKAKIIREKSKDKKGASHLFCQAPLAMDYEKAIFVVKKAEGDLQSNIKEKLSVKKRVHQCEDILEAFSQLHAINYVHGDVKPENFLRFKNKTLGNDIVKLTDWGKSIDLASGSTWYTGNRIFWSGEQLSKASEVYSVAILIIVLLETPLLQCQPRKNGMLRQPNHPRNVVLEKDMQGIQKYLFLSTEYLESYLNQLMYFSEKRKEEVDSYIVELCNQYKQSDLLSSKQALDLEELLKGMTLIDQKERYSIDQAKEAFHAIFFPDIQ